MNLLVVFSKTYSNIKFHENPSSGSTAVPCERTDGQADMTKLIVAFRHFANAPKSPSGCTGTFVSYILLLVLRQDTWQPTGHSARQWKESQQRRWNSSFRLHVLTDSETHPARCPVHWEVISPVITVTRDIKLPPQWGSHCVEFYMHSSSYTF